MNITKNRHRQKRIIFQALLVLGCSSSPTNLSIVSIISTVHDPSTSFLSSYIHHHQTKFVRIIRSSDQTYVGNPHPKGPHFEA